MPTQPWLSILVKCHCKRNSPFPRQQHPESSKTPDSSSSSCSPDVPSTAAPEVSSLSKLPPRYFKETPQGFCVVEKSFASVSPLEYSRKNGFERPLNLLQLLSWAFFGIDIVLFCILLAFSLSPGAAVSFLFVVFYLVFWGFGAFCLEFRG